MAHRGPEIQKLKLRSIRSLDQKGLTFGFPLNLSPQGIVCIKLHRSGLAKGRKAATDKRQDTSAQGWPTGKCVTHWPGLSPFRLRPFPL